MKYIVSIVAIMALSFSSIYAGEEYEKTEVSPYMEVQKLAGGFEVELNDDNSVTVSWDSFE